MASDLKVTNIKHSSSGSNNLVLASDGNVSITNTLSAGTIGSSVNFPAEHIINVGYGSLSNMSSQTGTWETSIVLGTTSGAPELKSSSNDVYLEFGFILQNRTNATGQHVSVYFSGGGLGADASGQLIGNIGYGSIQYDSQVVSSAVTDTAPGSTTPTYKIYCSASGNSWHFQNIRFFFAEIKK